jgi:hypothetical protein
MNKKMSIASGRMINGKKYYIHHRRDDEYYIGVFKEGHSLPTFEDVIELTETGFRYMSGWINFDLRARYYDPDIIKENAEKARQSMEKRALDMILKRLINEDFEHLYI